MVYVDTGAAAEAMDPDQTEDLPMPSLEDLRENEPLDGLTQEQLETFRDRAVPEPAGALRDAPVVTNEARRDVPSTVIATGFTSAEYQEGVEKGWGFLAGLADLDNLHLGRPAHQPLADVVQPVELAAILGEIATHASDG